MQGSDRAHEHYFALPLSLPTGSTGISEQGSPHQHYGQEASGRYTSCRYSKQQLGMESEEKHGFVLEGRSDDCNSLGWLLASRGGNE